MQGREREYFHTMPFRRYVLLGLFHRKDVGVSEVPTYVLSAGPLTLSISRFGSKLCFFLAVNFSHMNYIRLRSILRHQ